MVVNENTKQYLVLYVSREWRKFEWETGSYDFPVKCGGELTESSKDKLEKMPRGLQIWMSWWSACLTCMRPWVLLQRCRKPDTVVCSCNPSTQEVETGGSEVKSSLGTYWVQGTLGYMRFCFIQRRGGEPKGPIRPKGEEGRRKGRVGRGRSRGREVSKSLSNPRAHQCVH